jgi:hypothetical protein
VYPATSYTVRASNSGGSSEVTLWITVNDLPPQLQYDSNSVTFSIGVDKFFAPIVNASAGVITSFTVTPTLPNGIDIDRSGQLYDAPGTIYSFSGSIPMVPSTARNYVVCAACKLDRSSVSDDNFCCVDYCVELWRPVDR